MGAQKLSIILPPVDEIPDEGLRPWLRVLVDMCQQQREEIGMLRERVAQLEDEIAILKGQKPRPKIKPSALEDNREEQKRRDGRGSNHKGAKRVPIHKDEVIKPQHVPEGSVFKGYRDYIVQGIKFEIYNLRYRLERWLTPEGEYVTGELPEGVQGCHFSSELRSYILYQYYQQHVTQPLILEGLLELGVQISAGQVNNIITEGHEAFHQEKEEVLRAGLEVSSYVQVDDTSARHMGQNAVCTQIGNDLFAWFETTGSKSRVNFLELLRAGHKDYVINEDALGYMRQQGLPAEQLALLSAGGFDDKAGWEAYLRQVGITSERHVRIATEGALLASVLSHGVSPELVVLSDDAGQFEVAGLLHALCWIHAERTVHKLNPFTEENRQAHDKVRSEIWDFYQALKGYKINPSESERLSLDKRFDEIFQQKTCFQTLNLALERLHKNKTGLLVALRKPQVPLHNNRSEAHIRDVVKKRKISASTRNEEGKRCRDTFLSFKKTCANLGVSFWKFLRDRTSKTGAIDWLPNLIRLAAQSP